MFTVWHTFGKESTCNAEDPGSIPGLGRSTGEGTGYPLQYSLTSLVAQLVKNPPPGSIPGLGRSPGEGKGSPLQYSGLENSMDCIVHGLAKSWTGLSDIHFHFTHTHKIYIYVRVFKQHAKLCFGLFFK